MQFNPKSPQFWLAVISFAAVVGYATATLTRSSPGEITSAHAQDGSLLGPLSCSQCHGGWFGEMTTSCLECHEEIADQLEQKTGLHGIQQPVLAQRCQTCHSEHHGRGFRIVNKASFALAGVADVETFDHNVVGYRMEGKHLELGCKDCHTNADVEVLPDGEHRYLGLDSNCATCHDDAHNGAMRIDCTECHGQTSWTELSAPNHERILPLLGAHGEQTCAACHGEGGEFDLEKLGARNRRAYKQNCVACHESPHREDVITAVGLAEKRSMEASCGLCHAPDHMTFDDDRLAQSVTADRHAHTGFRLDTPHTDLTCAKCHGDAEHGTIRFTAADSFEKRHPGRTADGCATCHDDVHRGEFDDYPLAPNGCVDCHARTHFQPHAFTVEMHAETSFPLTGTHVETDCNACHPRIEVRAEPRVGPAPAGETTGVRFDDNGQPIELDDNGAPIDPQDPERRAKLERRIKEEQVADPETLKDKLQAAWGQRSTTDEAQDTSRKAGEPETQEERWARRREELRQRKLEIEERRAAAERERAANGGGEQPPAAGTTPSLTPTTTPPATPPPTALDRPVDPDATPRRTASPETVADGPTGRRAYLRTTATDAEKEPDPSPATSQDPAPTPRTEVPVFDGTPSLCQKCHEDAHYGYFEPDEADLLAASPSGTCAACHTTSHFAEVPAKGFDHGYYAGIEVNGAHEQAGCESCHIPSETADARGRKFGFIEDHFGEFQGCVTCHVDPHDGMFDDEKLPTEVGQRVGCARCHKAISFRAFDVAFDHGKWTGFELRGAHLEAQCSACHAPLPQRDPETGRTWARAAGTKCADCHKDPHAGQFAFNDGEVDCSRCHRDSADFKFTTFNHNVHSRFELGEAHEKVACDRCHGTFEHEGQEVVRYRPIPRRCTDCHGSAQSPFRRRSGTNRR